MAEKRKGSHAIADKPQPESSAIDTSDQALATLLESIKATKDPDEIRRLSDLIERVVFHKQFENA